jgi:carbamoylphosphate synthase large subunit
LVGVASASFEPIIDYVVTKILRFAFEKFPQAGACARPPSVANPASK